MKLIDLSKNLNPYMPTRKICKYLRDNMTMITHYPSMGIKALTHKIAEQFDMCEDNMCLNIGSLEGIGLLLKILSKQSVGIFSPTFFGIKSYAQKQEYKIVEMDMDNHLYYNVESIESLAKEVDIIYLCNPNNPTLDEIKKEDLLSIIMNNQNCHFIIDETMQVFDPKYFETSVYKGYKRDKIEMRGDRAEISDFPLYLNTVAGGLDCRDQTIGGFSFVVKIYAVPVVEIIG